MRVTRSCKPTDLHWAALPELREKLKREGFDTVSLDVTLNRTPDDVEYDSLEEAAEDVGREGSPDRFNFTLRGDVTEKGVGDETFRLYLHRFSDTLILRMDGLRKKSQLDPIMQFLGLEPEEPDAEEPSRPRTAFIAHKFDETGSDAAERLERFLKLLDFRVVTGRPYSPRSISEKVLSRMEGQEVVFVILTEGTSDDTWVTQESAIAKVMDKDPFLIKDEAAEFKAGILGDREYITFVPPNIEATFIPVLQGLRDLGY